MDFPLVGVLGAGPEVRLAYAAANRLGVRFRVLAQTARDSAARIVSHAVAGDVGDLHVLQAFADHCSVVLQADADVPLRQLQALEQQGTLLVPSVAELSLLEDPAALAERLRSAGLDQGEAAGGPSTVLTVLAARSRSGQAVAYPPASEGGDETSPRVVAPALGVDDDDVVAAQELALRVVAALDAVGVLTVRVTVRPGGGPVVASVGSLTIGSGGWTVESCLTDAFEQHLRAALDLPLGSPELVAPYSATATVVGRDDYAQLYPAYRHVLARDPGLRVRMYGREVADGVPVGHVTALGGDPASVQERVAHAAGYLRGDIVE